MIPPEKETSRMSLKTPSRTKALHKPDFMSQKILIVEISL